MKVVESVPHFSTVLSCPAQLMWSLVGVLFLPNFLVNFPTESFVPPTTSLRLAAKSVSMTGNPYIDSFYFRILWRTSFRTAKHCVSHFMFISLWHVNRILNWFRFLIIIPISEIWGKYFPNPIYSSCSSHPKLDSCRICQTISSPSPKPTQINHSDLCAVEWKGLISANIIDRQEQQQEEHEQREKFVWPFHKNALDIFILPVKSHGRGRHD